MENSGFFTWLRDKKKEKKKAKMGKRLIGRDGKPVDVFLSYGGCWRTGCTGKSCSQCQNRGQVEVYGGWWVSLDWLRDGGGDAETGGGGGVGGLLYAKASGASRRPYR